jgi:dipeptidyl aminopeptidase/acylaminoacyl peptidase
MTTLSRLSGGTVALGALALSSVAVRAEVVTYGGSAEPLAHERFVHVVSESVAPVQEIYVEAADGLYIAAALRKPPGPGPFPALIVFHGAPGGRGMEQLVGWSRGDHGGPVWERFLQEGFVVMVADYRGGDIAQMNAPSSAGLVTAIDDGVAVVAHVRALPFVDPSRVSVYGVSLGGNLAMYLASKIPDLHSVVAGAPAPIWFLGCALPEDRSQLDFSALRADPAVARANIEPISTPILLQAGTADTLLPLVRMLHDELEELKKQVRLEIYEHGYHDFVLGPQGQVRRDMPEGEVLLEGTLAALERSVAFVKGGG